MNVEQYRAFKNKVDEIQKENSNRIKGKISDYYHFAEDEKTLIWDKTETLPIDIVLKVNQAAAKYLA